MKNTANITQIAAQLVKIYERIESLTYNISHNEMEGQADYVEMYTDMRFAELEQAQHLTLMLTDLVVQDAEEGQPQNVNGDDSAFIEGELDNTKTSGDCAEGEGNNE